MEAEKVGVAIRELRKRAGYSQQQLAELLGITDKAVSRWERGIGVPDISIVTKLSTFLNVDTDNLLDGNVTFLNHDWVGELRVYQHPCGLGPLSMVHDIPLIYIWLSYFLLVGVKIITLVGEDNLLSSIKQELGNGEKYGVLIRYDKEEDECLNCKMIIEGSFFLYGANLTKYFQRSIVRKNGITVLVAPTFFENEDNIFFLGDRKIKKECDTLEAYRLLPISFVPAKFNQMWNDISVADLIEKGLCFAEPVGRGVLYSELCSWKDFDRLAYLMSFLQETTGEYVFRPEEIAWRRGLIGRDTLLRFAVPNTDYGAHLLNLTGRGKN